MMSNGANVGSIPDPETKGRLLIAAPPLVDPNFDRTVIYVIDHNDEGALGVILNRPLDTPIDEALPGWDLIACAPQNVFSGGPVQPTAVIGLGLANDVNPPDDSWAPLVGRLGTIDLSTDPGSAANRMDSLRIFAGYAGWGAGQLENEIAAGGWFLTDALLEDIFSERPERLWREVLRRQHGPLALVSTFPADPTMN